MNCPTCNTTKIKRRSDTAWGIPWEPHKDEAGKLHKHDPNKHFIDYRCQNGHVFEQTYFPECKCGWQALNT